MQSSKLRKFSQKKRWTKRWVYLFSNQTVHLHIPAIFFCCDFLARDSAKSLTLDFFLFIIISVGAVATFIVRCCDKDKHDGFAFCPKLSFAEFRSETFSLLLFVCVCLCAWVKSCNSLHLSDCAFHFFPGSQLKDEKTHRANISIWLLELYLCVMRLIWKFCLKNWQTQEMHTWQWTAGACTEKLCYQVRQRWQRNFFLWLF